MEKLRVIHNPGVTTYPSFRGQHIKPAQVQDWFKRADWRCKYAIPDLQTCGHAALEISEHLNILKDTGRTVVVSRQTAKTIRAMLACLQRDQDQWPGADWPLLHDARELLGPFSHRPRPQPTPAEQLALHLHRVAVKGWQSTGPHRDVSQDDAQKAPSSCDPASPIVAFVILGLEACRYGERPADTVSGWLRSHRDVSQDARK